MVERKLETAFLILAGSYLCLLLFAIVLLYKRKTLSWFRRSWWMSFIAFTTIVLLRPLYFTFEAGLFNCVPGSINYFTLTFPAFCWFFLYMGLILLWGDIYVGSKTGSFSPLLRQFNSNPYTKKLQLLVTMASVVVAAAAIMLYSYLFIKEGLVCQPTLFDQETVETVYIYCAASIYFMTCPIIIGFWLWSYATYVRMYQEGNVNNEHLSVSQRKMSVKLGFLIFFCSLCLVTRGVVMVLQTSSSTIDPNGILFNMMYYYLLEMLPLVLISTTFIQNINKSPLSTT